MNITRQNYESVFIDYYDGNLTTDQVDALFLFLKSHPDLAEEFETFNSIQIEAPEVFFPYKDSLKRNEVNETNFPHYMIGKLEGDLTNDEIIRLDVYVKNNPDKLRDQILFNLTKVKANQAIIFDNKAVLKQVIPFKRTAIYYGIAAIFLIAFIAGSTLIFYKSNQLPVSEIATNEPVKNEPQDVPPASIQSTHPTVLDSIKTESKTEKLIPAEKKSIEKKSPNPVINTPEIKTPLPEIQLAQQIQLHGINQVIDNKIIPSINEEPKVKMLESTLTPPAEEYLTIWEALKHASQKSIEKEIMDNGDAALANNSSEPAKGKFLGIIGGSIRKLSKDKVRLQTNYDADKQMVAYSFKAGGLSIEKK